MDERVSWLRERETFEERKRERDIQWRNSRVDATKVVGTLRVSLIYILF